MIIRRIDLKNVRGIKQETLKLVEGGFAVVGPNGSGKSTWIYSLDICFYGSTPELNLGDMLNWDESEAEVTVWFENSLGMFRITRTFNEKSSKVKVERYQNNTWEIIGGAELIDQIVRIPQTVFGEVLIKRQDEFGSLAKATPAGRYKIFKEFANLEVWEKYGRKNQELIQDLSSRAALLERDIETAKKTIADMGLRPITEKEKTDLKDALDKAVALKVEAEKSRDEKSAYLKQLDEFNKAQEDLEKFKDAKVWLDKWESVKAIEKPEVLFSEEALTAANDKLKTLSEELETIPGEIQKVSAEIEELSTELKDLTEVKQPEVDSRIEEIRTKNFEIQKEISDIQREIDLVSQGKCPTCGRSFQKIEKRVEELELRLNDLKLIDLSPLQTESARIKARVSEIIKDQRALGNKRSILEARSKTLNDEIKLVTSRINLLNSSKEQTLKYADKELFFKQYPYSGVKPEEAYQKLLVASSVEKPGDDPVPGQTLSEIRDLVESLHNQINQLNINIHRLGELDKQYHYQTSRIEEAEKELAKIKPDLDVHNALKEVYSRTGAPSKVIRRWLKTVEIEANKLLNRLIEGRFTIEFKDRTPTGRETIDIIIKDNLKGGERKYASLSGGEKTRVNVALALALSNAFSLLTGIEVDTIFFDEVYGLDENGQQDFARAIESISKEKTIVGAISCFQSMSAYFETTIQMRDGRIV